MTIIMIEGKPWRWKDILELRRAQQKARRQPSQEPLFPLHDDSRPCTQRTAKDRFEQPMLFEK
jgi:hypothetical protein